MLRKHGVVGKFVEFFGTGLDDMSVANRATISNMAPEYGATCGFFPVDAKTMDYLRTTGRSDERIALVEAYCRAQGMFRDATTADPVFTDVLELDLGSVLRLLARSDHDRVLLVTSSTSSGNVAEVRELRSPTGFRSVRRRRYCRHHLYQYEA
jgi:aconitate hydratase